MSLKLFQYQHINQTKKDVTDVIEQYRGLTFKLENFGQLSIFFFLVAKKKVQSLDQVIVLK